MERVEAFAAPVLGPDGAEHVVLVVNELATNSIKYGGGAGDLLVTIHVAPHPWFRREGNNLLLDVPPERRSWPISSASRRSHRCCGP